jgi:hypothetical protein
MLEFRNYLNLSSRSATKQIIKTRELQRTICWLEGGGKLLRVQEDSQCTYNVMAQLCVHCCICTYAECVFVDLGI